MPGSSKKRKPKNMPGHAKSKKLKNDKAKKHAGGPIKRKGDAAEEWEKIIGPSIDAIPEVQLPTARSILQRYRAMKLRTPKNQNEAKL